MSELRSGTAAARWADALEQWAIPQHIVDAAPEGPWRFPPVVFAWTPQRAAATSRSEGPPLQLYTSGQPPAAIVPTSPGCTRAG